MPNKAPTNPRGTLWSKDEGRFGFRLLEKMGWKKGQGLGANEDGVVEPVKVRSKNDCKGVGFKDSDDQWTAHHEAFNALLSHLNGTHVNLPTQHNIRSLEETSKKSKSRVHYQKFTRSKDLSRCTEKDLACILGKPKQKDYEDTAKSPNVTSSYSIQEYFAQKVATLKTRREKDEGEIQENTGKTEASELASADKSKRQRRKKVESLKKNLCNIQESGVAENESSAFSSTNLENENLTENAELLPKKRKRKHRDKNGGIAHMADVQQDEVAVEGSQENNIDCEIIDAQLTNEIRCKRRKKKKQCEVQESQNFDNEVATQLFHCSFKDGISTDSDLSSKKKSKRKHRGTAEISVTADLQPLVEEAEAVFKKRKRSKQANNTENKHIGNGDITGRDEEVTEHSGESQKQSKKSKKARKTTEKKVKIDEQSSKTEAELLQLKEIEQFMGNEVPSNNKNDSVSHMKTRESSPQMQILSLSHWNNIGALLSQKPKTVELAKAVVNHLRETEPFKGSNLFEVIGYGNPEGEYTQLTVSFTLSGGGRSTSSEDKLQHSNFLYRNNWQVKEPIAGPHRLLPTPNGKARAQQQSQDTVVRWPHGLITQPASAIGNQ